MQIVIKLPSLSIIVEKRDGSLFTKISVLGSVLGRLLSPIMKGEEKPKTKSAKQKKG